MSLRILIVEDELIVACDLEGIAEASGHEVVGLAGQVSDARSLAALKPEMAIVDINLRDGPTGPHISAQLARDDVTVVLVTANLDQIPLNFCGAIGAVAKPFTSRGISEVMAYVERLRREGEPETMPADLIVADGGPIWRQARIPCAGRELARRG
jgi:response regulator of citrate/malate metabolism